MLPIFMTKLLTVILESINLDMIFKLPLICQSRNRIDVLIFRSSRPEVFCEKLLLESSQNS